MHSIISKYNVPGPRYTSYPTVPYWDEENFSLKDWKRTLQQSFKESNSSEGISLYIHLPYCESMCTFCGCNKRITKNHKVEVPYIQLVIQEFKLYTELFQERPKIKQLHLGGGTPTFFSAEHLDRLLCGLLTLADKAPNFEFSFEGHPNNTTTSHLETLASHGFKRVCYGVQDYNLKVQKAINRIQPYANVKTATENAYSAGFTSVGHDIIYGLPFQTLEDVINTIDKTISLQPDRIAYYSYAHVPWIKGNGQRGFNNNDLPSAALKREQYEAGKNKLIEAGYVEIGMDHFALKTDSLYKAQQNGTIHRNFMGYCDSKTQVMIGLGVSAIGDSWYSFAQNVKNIEAYEKLIVNKILPISKGHILTSEDLKVRMHILNLMCTFKTEWNHNEQYLAEIPDILTKLKELQADGLIILTEGSVEITEKGRPFLRNVCMPFDLRLQQKQPDRPLFSMTV